MLIPWKHYYDVEVEKYYCHVCFRYIKHSISKDDFSIYYFKQFGGFKIKEISLYEKSDIMCYVCFKQFKIMNFRYKKNVEFKNNMTTLIKSFPHISIYNKHFIYHIKLQKKINAELIEYLFHPKLIWNWLNSSGNNDIENYLN